MIKAIRPHVPVAWRAGLETCREDAAAIVRMNPRNHLHRTVEALQAGVIFDHPDAIGRVVLALHDHFQPNAPERQLLDSVVPQYVMDVVSRDVEQ